MQFEAINQFVKQQLLKELQIPVHEIMRTCREKMNIHALASISKILILETYPVKDGMIDASTEIGLGMEPDAGLVKKYRVE